MENKKECASHDHTLKGTCLVMDWCGLSRTEIPEKERLAIQEELENSRIKQFKIWKGEQIKNNSIPF